MANFKEQINADLSSVFINEDEFGSVHNIDGVDMLIVLDNDELERRKQSKINDYTGGVYEGDLLFYALEDEFGYRPKIDQIIRFDGAKYRITDFSSDMGVYIIALLSNKAGR
ncbi:MAG: hypothetical protein LBQ68_00575 [Clostridiales bacterium]|jgi:hypothetical protein|nr:hypothetical protein [Clostridiales bacterium]